MALLMAMIITLWGATLPSLSYGEIYQGIGPLDSLADVKKMFPKATFEKVETAWGKEWDALYKVTGAGINGKIIIKFFDTMGFKQEPEAPESKHQYRVISPEEQTDDPGPASNQGTYTSPPAGDPAPEAPPPPAAESRRSVTFVPVDLADVLPLPAPEAPPIGLEKNMEVQWVRWIPMSPIPLQRLITKYGKPDEDGFRDDDFRPFKSWTKKNINANLSDDGKMVTDIEFAFTNGEQRIAYLVKRRYIPFWLQEPKKQANKPEKKK